MERARSRLARNGGLDELGVLQASRLQEELTRREVRRASEAAAAAKKNGRLRLKREKKAAQRREELRQAHQREYDRGAVYLPPVLEPPKTPPAPTEQEVGEEWRAAREEVAGLLPADWGSHHADRVQWCLGWLAHTDKRRRMSALHSLHAFLSPAIDAEFGVELCRDGVDQLIAAHADDIAGHLRRSLAAAAAASSRCVEERLLAVMVAGLVLLWSKESCAIVREKLLDVLARHTRVGRTDDDGDSDGDDSQAEPERVRGHHDVVNPDDLRAAAVEVLGMMHFLHYYGTEPAEGADGDGDAEDPVVELIETTFTRLCADERTPATVRATALSVIGLLSTLLPAPCLASWLDTNVELVLGFLSHDDISMRLAGADALLVFLAAIHDDLAFVVDDAGDGDGEAGVEAELLSAVPGQHELFQLRSRLEEMVKARDRRASKADNKALRSLVERLLKLSHALTRRTDQLKARNADNGDDEDDDDNDDEDDDDDDEEEEEEYIVGRGSPRLQVTLRPMGRNNNGYWSPGVQPELAVYSERHRKQLEAIMALTGSSLRLYLHGGGLAELVACVVDENELVARVKPSPDSDDDDYRYPREPKGANVSKGKHPSVVFGDWEAQTKVSSRRIKYARVQRLPYGSVQPWWYRHTPGRGVVDPDPSLFEPNPNVGGPPVTDSRLPEELQPAATGGRYARVILKRRTGMKRSPRVSLADY